ncbi:hypothetical protein SteCoe_28831 [Stentor coeruleus]|uniref:PNPLA domain-containing protein n=1 Tax=Stentor coeruleus TaxID=5963 RepID=A0A1R2B782_9CILI|nr:hypothetical protein SteCoe_28831 [Stentor coeruleus]
MLIFLFIAAVKCQKVPDKCRILAISGGASYGAYEAGAFSGLVEFLHPDDVMYNVIVGISVGSINALGLSQFEYGQEKQASEYLINTWQQLDAHRSIMKPWPYLGVLAGFIYKSGLFDTSPERETLEKVVNSTFIRKFIAGMTNVATGEYETFSELADKNTMIDAVMCSSAIPGFFPMQKMNDTYYVDGGVKFMLEIASGIEMCLKDWDEEDIIVDMISCNYRNFTKELNMDYKTQDVLDRADVIRRSQKTLKIIDSAMVSYPKANFRYFINPIEDLPGYIGMRFDKYALEICLSIGYQSAKEMILNNITARDLIKLPMPDDLILYA